jgi:hypothetical protein
MLQRFATTSMLSYFFGDVLKYCKYVFIFVFFVKIVGDFYCQSFW